MLQMSLKLPEAAAMLDVVSDARVLLQRYCRDWTASRVRALQGVMESGTLGASANAAAWLSRWTHCWGPEMKRCLLTAGLLALRRDTGVASAQDAHPLSKDELLQVLLVRT